ncbi:MAG TPA: cytochrome C [Desulfobacteraceae bacterium]|nr:cytochrome C [Desulfobacteraceae bacterium]
MIKRTLNSIVLIPFAFLLGLFLMNPSICGASRGSGCTTKDCHAGIMDIVPGKLPMMALIQQNGLRHGDMDGCVVCHGGNPSTRKKEKAHQGIPESLQSAPGPKNFYPDPGDIWIAKNTCGICHAGYVERAQKSLMNTEAGKIQGNLNTWGTEQGYRVHLGNHEMGDDDGPVPSGMSLAYETYMTEMKKGFPDQFPDHLNRLPSPSIEEVEANPSLAALVYQRRECQRCHIGVRGRNARGDFRGKGCSACHMPYGNEGLYQGKDKSIPKDEPGHILRHRIAGNRKTGGIPVATCNTCHNRGKRIGVSFSGLMESPFAGPFDDKGAPQPKLHGKTYTQVSEDLHHRRQSRDGNPEGGLLCQDCHTSLDVHGDGNFQGTTLAQVEIECTDCHGTPTAYPWDLPLGHGDEFGRKPSVTARGTADTRLMSSQQFGFDYAPGDGYILSARGNPLGNVVKIGNGIIVHSATGRDYRVPVLKNQSAVWKTEETPANTAATVAMAGVSRHMERMECYACHGSWAPQCYGCHVSLDYTDPKATGTDWVAVSNREKELAESSNDHPVREVDAKTPGDIREMNGYMRWETPVLGINGEGRVSPLIPGCQVVYTLIGSNGTPRAHNMVPENPVEASAAGQSHIPLAMDMAPVQPHTASPKARSCESCHNTPKTLGLGINGGQFKTTGTRDLVVDLHSPDTLTPLPKTVRVQIPGIPAMPFDWSAVSAPDGTQLATVGTHWPLSRAFNREEQQRISRTGLCIGCHRYQGSRAWEKLDKEGTLDNAAHSRLMGELLKKSAHP